MGSNNNTNNHSNKGITLEKVLLLPSINTHSNNSNNNNLGMIIRNNKDNSKDMELPCLSLPFLPLQPQLQLLLYKEGILASGQWDYYPIILCLIKCLLLQQIHKHQHQVNNHSNHSNNINNNNNISSITDEYK